MAQRGVKLIKGNNSDLLHNKYIILFVVGDNATKVMLPDIN